LRGRARSRAALGTSDVDLIKKPILIRKKA